MENKEFLDLQEQYEEQQDQDIVDDIEEQSQSEEELGEYQSIYGKIYTDAEIKGDLNESYQFDNPKALGLIRGAYYCVGELNFDQKGTTSVYTFRNGQAAYMFCRAVTFVTGYRAEISFVKPHDKRKMMRYTVELPERTTFDLLQKVNVISLNPKTNKITRISNKLSKFTDEDFQKGVLTMLYMECGRLSFYGDYKLEFRFEGDNQPQEFCVLLASLKIHTGLLEDSKKTILRTEAIYFFFGIIGVDKVAVAINQYYFNRELTRDITRTENFRLANLDKALTAAANQLVSIKNIRESGKFGRMSKDLQELAILREQNPDVSIQELAKIAGISKSTAYHRMERIIDFSKEIK